MYTNLTFIVNNVLNTIFRIPYFFDVLISLVLGISNCYVM